MEIKNVDRLLKRLNNLSKTNLKETMNKATAIVQGSAKALASVDTGNLRNSIHMKVTVTSNGCQGKVYTNVEYAPFVEFGTGIKGNGTYPYKLKNISLAYRDSPWIYTPDGKKFYYTKGQKAQPFMYPALEQNKKLIKKMFHEELKDKLNKQVKGG